MLLDGGVRRGSHVVKAIALGATACLIGRPHLWGLAVAGEAGVAQVLEIFRRDIDRVLALGGWDGIARVDRSVLVPTGGVAGPRSRAISRAAAGVRRVEHGRRVMTRCRPARRRTQPRSAMRGAVLPETARVIERGFEWLARVLFVLVALALFALAISLVLSGAWQLVRGAFGGEVGIYNLMNGVGLLIVSLAIADVAKFVVEENVVRERELRSPAEALRSLTKFMTIIIIALSLEAVVGIFEAGREKHFDRAGVSDPGDGWRRSSPWSGSAPSSSSVAAPIRRRRPIPIARVLREDAPETRRAE